MSQHIICNFTTLLNAFEVICNGGATVRRLGNEDHFEVNSFHATSIDIMSNVENIAGTGPWCHRPWLYALKWRVIERAFKRAMNLDILMGNSAYFLLVFETMGDAIVYPNDGK